MFNDLQKLDDLVNLFHHDVQVPFAAITIQNCCVAGIQNLRVLRHILDIQPARQ